MVLQRETEVSIWGWGRPREKIVLTTGWDNESYQTTVTNQGTWSVKIPTGVAGGPYTLDIQGHNLIRLEDILLGEVWLCSGQSNMEWSANAGIDDAEQHIREAHHPDIRFFDIPTTTAPDPQIDLNGSWSVCTPATMRKTTAIGYFFGCRLKDELGVPIGLINSTWGGTSVEAWSPRRSIESVPKLKAAADILTPVPWGPVRPGTIYNAMIHPLMPFHIAGVIWYQGEANVPNGNMYEELLSNMVSEWRSGWRKDFPFYLVQIAPYRYGTNSQSQVVRDEQRKAAESIPNSGLVVVSDIGNLTDIHPRNKLDVGIRLANLALVNTYKFSDRLAHGPLPEDAVFAEREVLISFLHGNGLHSKGYPISEFEVAGEDGVWHPAEASIEGESVRLTVEAVPSPRKVRFAWSNTATPHVYNRADLPASCFLIEKE